MKGIYAALAYIASVAAKDDKCRVLAFSSGDESAAYQAGALKGFTTSNYNVAIGYQAGTVVTTGGNNVFLGGYRAGYANTSGNNNLFCFKIFLYP